MTSGQSGSASSLGLTGNGHAEHCVRDEPFAMKLKQSRCTMFVPLFSSLSQCFLLFHSCASGAAHLERLAWIEHIVRVYQRMANPWPRILSCVLTSRQLIMLWRALDARLRDEFEALRVVFRALIGRHGTKTYDSGSSHSSRATEAPGWLACADVGFTPKQVQCLRV